MKRLFTRFPSFIVGVIVATTVTVAYASFFDRVPYHSVTLEHLHEFNGNTYITTSFVKTNCQFKDLRVLAYTFGRWKHLPWTDTQTPRGDRFAGRHTLEIYYPSGPYDFVEIRTRHDCDGISVDKLFLEIDDGSRSQKHTEE